ncbi:hypothetical protein RIF29_21638 [Crotalaria pallida]|uniref:Uncharacterized protein n=1 Tax=Crotalaria pallida TaxID=3830 RepID=A0AAN9I644_CROPI
MKDDHTRATSESIIIDFSKLDDIDLDSLPPTQAEKVLEALEEIKIKLAGRNDVSLGFGVRSARALGVHEIALGKGAGGAPDGDSGIAPGGAPDVL